MRGLCFRVSVTQKRSPFQPGRSLSSYAMCSSGASLRFGTLYYTRVKESPTAVKDTHTDIYDVDKDTQTKAFTHVPLAQMFKPYQTQA